MLEDRCVVIAPISSGPAHFNLKPLKWKCLFLIFILWILFSNLAFAATDNSNPTFRDVFDTPQTIANKDVFDIGGTASVNNQSVILTYHTARGSPGSFLECTVPVLPAGEETYLIDVSILAGGTNEGSRLVLGYNLGTVGTPVNGVADPRYVLEVPHPVTAQMLPSSRKGYAIEWQNRDANTGRPNAIKIWRTDGGANVLLYSEELAFNPLFFLKRVIVEQDGKGKHQITGEYDTGIAFRRTYVFNDGTYRPDGEKKGLQFLAQGLGGSIVSSMTIDSWLLTTCKVPQSPPSAVILEDISDTCKTSFQETFDTPQTIANKDVFDIGGTASVTNQAVILTYHTARGSPGSFLECTVPVLPAGEETYLIDVSILTGGTNEGSRLVLGYNLGPVGVAVEGVADPRYVLEVPHPVTAQMLPSSRRGYAIEWQNRDANTGRPNAIKIWRTDGGANVLLYSEELAFNPLFFLKRVIVEQDGKGKHQITGEYDTGIAFRRTYVFNDGTYRPDGEKKGLQFLAQGLGGSIVSSMTIDNWIVQTCKQPPNPPNDLPTVDSVVLQSESGDTRTAADTEDLILTFFVSDPEGAVVSTRILWRVDRGMGFVHQPSLDNIDRIPDQNTSRGETWVAEVIPSDGVTEGDTGKSNTILIQPNRPPQVISLVLRSESGDQLQAADAEDLILDSQIVDPDGDTIGTRIRWFANNMEKPSVADRTRIDGAFTSGGEIWRAEVTPNDGMMDGSAASSNSVAIVALTAVISSPSANAAVSGEVPIVGTVSDIKPVTWNLQAISVSSGSIIPIGSGAGNVINQTLAVWNTASLADGLYTLVLSAQNSLGATASFSVTVSVNNTISKLTGGLDTVAWYTSMTPHGVGFATNSSSGFRERFSFLAVPETFFAPNRNPGVGYSRGVDVDLFGHLWILTPEGYIVTSRDSFSILRNVGFVTYHSDIAIASDGTIWILSWYNDFVNGSVKDNRITVYNNKTGVFKKIADVLRVGGLNNPNPNFTNFTQEFIVDAELIADKDSTIWIAAFVRRDDRSVSPSQQHYRVMTMNNKSGSFSNPETVVISPTNRNSYQRSHTHGFMRMWIDTDNVPYAGWFRELSNSSLEIHIVNLQDKTDRILAPPGTGFDFDPESGNGFFGSDYPASPNVDMLKDGKLWFALGNPDFLSDGLTFGNLTSTKLEPFVSKMNDPTMIRATTDRDSAFSTLSYRFSDNARQTLTIGLSEIPWIQAMLRVLNPSQQGKQFPNIQDGTFEQYILEFDPLLNPTATPRLRKLYNVTDPVGYRVGPYSDNFISGFRALEARRRVVTPITIPPVDFTVSSADGVNLIVITPPQFHQHVQYNVYYFASPLQLLTPYPVSDTAIMHRGLNNGDTIGYFVTAVINGQEAPLGSFQLASPTTDRRLPQTTYSIDGPVFKRTSDIVHIASQSVIRFKPDIRSSLLSRIEASIDDGPFVEIGNGISFQTEGQHIVRFRGVDAVSGFVEPSQTIVVFVDNSPPTTMVMRTQRAFDVPFSQAPPEVNVGPSFTDNSGQAFISSRTSFEVFAQDRPEMSSGVASSVVKIDGQPVVSFQGGFTTDTFSISSEGSHIVTAASVDHLGNQESPVSTHFIVDNTPPAINLVVNSHPISLAETTIFLNASSLIQINAVDAGAGLSGIFVSIDGSSFTRYEGENLSFTQEGPHTLRAVAFDNLINISDTFTVDVILDLTAPVVAAVRSPAANANGWNDTVVTVEYIATDTLTGIDPVASDLETDVLSMEGTGQTASAFAVDLAGNRTDVIVSNINIDLTSPVTILSINKPNVIDDQTFVTSATPITLTATDSLSGVVKTEFRFDGGPFTIGTTFTIPLPEGLRAVEFRSMDAAGNVERERTAQMIVDNTPPSTILSMDITDTTGAVLIPQSEITLSAFDGGPVLTPAVGVGRIEYRIDGGETHIYTSPFSVNSVGPHTVTYQAFDRLGNAESAKNFMFTVKPALLASKFVSFTPRVLVWLNNQGDGEGDERDDDDDGDQGAPSDNLSILKSILDSSPILLYDIVDRPDTFVSLMRSDSYNVYLIIGDKKRLKKEHEWELAERVRMGDGLISSFMDKIDLPLHDESEQDGEEGNKGEDKSPEQDIKASKNLLGVDVNGKHSAKDIKLTLSSVAVTYAGEYQTRDKTKRVRALSGTALGDGFVPPKGKNKLPEPAIVSNVFGAGKTVFFAFDVGQSASSSNSDSTSRLLRAALQYVTPTQEIFIPDGRVAVGIGVQSLVVPVDLSVRIEEALPEGSYIVNKLKGDIQSNVVVWNLTLDATESDIVHYIQGLADVGDVEISAKADVFYRVGGNYILSSRLEFPVTTEKNLLNLLDLVIAEFNNLISSGHKDRSKIKKAVETLRKQSLQPPVSKDEIDAAIRDILKIVRDLDGLSANSPKLFEIRDTLDKIILIYGRRLGG